MAKVQRDRLKLGSEYRTATVEFDHTVKMGKMAAKVSFAYIKGY